MPRESARPRRRPDELTNEDIQERWRVLTPMFVKYFLLSCGLSLSVYLLNHFIVFSQGTVRVLTVAFQIGVAASVLFAFLILMAGIFGGQWVRGRPK